MFFGEAIIGALLKHFGGSLPLPLALLLSGGLFGKLIVGYPLLPWLATMMLGWVSVLLRRSAPGLAVADGGLPRFLRSFVG